jgi:hypothetical protein
MKIIGLVPVKNGEEYIRKWFHQNQNLVDGFIVFNDNSTDNTKSILNTIPNVLSIVDSQKNDGIFNDAYNRNILLNEARKFNPDYIFWIDIDEVWVDMKDIRTFLENDLPTQLYIPLIHLYNSEQTYIQTYPKSHYGIQWKCRIVKFSEYYNFKFSEKTPLHFKLSPSESPMMFYPMLAKHYGIIDDVKRDFKYHFYKKNDLNNSQSYSHIISNSHKIGNIDNIIKYIQSLNII